MGLGELGDTELNGILKATEGKDNRSRDKEEEDAAPEVEDWTTSMESASRIGLKVMKPSESECVDVDKFKVLP